MLRNVVEFLTNIHSAETGAERGVGAHETESCCGGTAGSAETSAPWSSEPVELSSNQCGGLPGLLEQMNTKGGLKQQKPTFSQARGQRFKTRCPGALLPSKALAEPTSLLFLLWPHCRSPCLCLHMVPSVVSASLLGRTAVNRSGPFCASIPLP